MLAALSGTPAHAVTAAEAIRLANLERAALGIGPLTEDARINDGCNKHNAYQQQNGTSGHDEDPNKPGYTPEGRDAGALGILSSGPDDGEWSETTNPWSAAPLHLAELLSPTHGNTGYASTHGRTCMSWAGSPGVGDPNAPTFFSWPANGSSGHFTAEHITNELPTGPARAVGLPSDDVVTGPAILMFSTLRFASRGPLWIPCNSEDPAEFTAAMTGPASAVDARSRCIDPGQGLVLPVQPLQPRTTYTVQATWKHSYSDQTAAQTLTFTTGDQRTLSDTAPRNADPEVGVEDGQDAVAPQRPRAARLTAVARLRAGRLVITGQLRPAQGRRQVQVRIIGLRRPIVRTIRTAADGRISSQIRLPQQARLRVAKLRVEMRVRATPSSQAVRLRVRVRPA
jgi:hypothetical protein